MARVQSVERPKLEFVAIAAAAGYWLAARQVDGSPESYPRDGAFLT